MLVGMVPAMLVMEPGEKDAVRRMGWVRKKDQVACWEAGPVNLTKVWLLMPEERAVEHAGFAKGPGAAVVKGFRVAPIVCLACPTPSQPILLHPEDI